jgi:hypothetical protein
MQRNRLNIALALVLAGLGLAIFFSQKKEEKKPPLTALVPENIARVTIEHPGAATIKLEKQGGVWWLTEPVKTEADKFEVNGILAIATLEQKKVLSPADVKLAELGLDPPQYSVTLDDQKLAIGGLEPLQFQRYIKSGEVLALTDDPPSAALDADYADLVNKSVIPDGADIQKIEVPGLTLAKGADGKWFVSPPDPAASADQMEKFAQAWRNAKSLWNEFDANAKDAKGDAVTLTLKDRTLTYLVVSREPQLQLERPEVGVRLNLSKALAEELLKLPAPPPEPAAATDVATPATEAVPPTESKK